MNSKDFKYEFEILPVKRINLKDETLKVRWKRATPKSLRDSIKTYGLLQPLLVKKSETESQQYQIISGFRRAHIISELKIENAPCFVAQSKLDFVDGLLLNINHHKHLEPLSSIDISNLVSKASKKISTGEIIESILNKAGLPSRYEVLENYLSLQNLIDEFKNELDGNTVSLSLAIRLSSYDEKVQRVLYNLFKNLRLTESLRKEFLGNLDDVSHRDDISITDILRKGVFAKILNDKALAPQKKMEKVRYVVKKLRYPMLTSLEDSFDKFAKSLNLPPQISLKASPFFEGNTYRLTIDFEEKETLKQSCQVIEKITNRMDEIKSLQFLNQPRVLQK